LSKSNQRAGQVPVARRVTADRASAGTDRRARLKLNSEIEDESVIVEPSTEADQCAAITAFITDLDFVSLQERACKLAVNRQNVLTLSLA
jgi:hypothetical protein